MQFCESGYVGRPILHGLGLLDVAHRHNVLTEHKITETVPVSIRRKYREEKRSIHIRGVSRVHAVNWSALLLLQRF